MLEIACWSSFTDRRGIGKSLWVSETDKLLTPDNLKKQYVRLAKKKIPPLLGTSYCEVVVSCLEGLPDVDATAQNSAAMSGSAYVEQVMEKLEEINL